MKSLFLLFLLTFNLVTYSQEVQGQKTFSPTNKSELFKDHDFTYVIEKLSLNVSSYTYVDFSTIINTRDSITKHKISYSSSNFNVSYKEISDSNIEHFRNKVIYDCSSNKPISRSTKNRLINVFKTLSPDNEGRYKIYFSLLEY